MKGTLTTQGPTTTGTGERPIARILRRGQILKIIEAEPKRRYEELKSFIAVPGIEKAETALGLASKNASEELVQAIKASQQAQEQLELLWQDEGTPGKDSFFWAETKSKEDLTALKNNLTTISSIIDLFSTSKSALSTLKKAEEDYSKAKEAKNTAETKLREAEKDGIAGGSSLVVILQDAQKYFEKHSATICPVCENDIEVESLKKRIGERLNSMALLTGLKMAFDDAVKNEDRTLSAISQASKSLTIEASKLAAKLKATTIPEVASFVADWGEYYALIANQPDEEALKQTLALLSVIAAGEKAIISQKDELGKSVHQYNAIKNHYQTIIDKTKAIIGLDLLDKRLKKTFDIVGKKRKEYVESILVAISDIVDAMFQKVHPGEEIGEVKFYLNPQFKGSLLFDGTFHSKSEIPPQAYYSESHLDTLGICVFLALAKYYKNDRLIVVLDDVLTSADNVHMDRLIQMLHDEADQFNQLIITTHYRPWFDRYKYPHASSAGQVQLIELLHWSIPRGIQHSRTKLAVDELQELLKKQPFERQAAASKSGILLEGILDHITLLYGCKIQRKATASYTLGELLGAISSKLRNVLKVTKKVEDKTGVESTTEIDIKPLLEKLENSAWIRNQVGCHFNVSSTVADNQITTFVHDTISLANAVVCSQCGEVSRRNIDGISWDCKCSKSKLQPLVIPGGMTSAIGGVE